jgi:hypothetical protein
LQGGLPQVELAELRRQPDSHAELAVEVIELDAEDNDIVEERPA